MNLKEYMMSINEEAGKRGRPKKTDAQRKAELDNAKKKPIPQDKIKPEQVDSKSLMPSKQEVWGRYAGQNGSGGVWEVDVPKGKDKYPPLDDATMNRNLKKLRAKFASKEDFFIQGEAGWGKTSLIIDMAGRYDRFVVTVYLDKAEAVDLGGMPYMDKNKDGSVVQKVAMPAWADLMKAFDKNNQDKLGDLDFLLFFDEMNQAQTDVMQALMPIILKHSICGYRFSNFFVGAAGNKEDEAELTALSKPLKSRLDPIIKWENDWNQSFNFLHGKWDDQIGKDFVSEFHKLAPEVFKNPREVEMKIFQHYKALKDDKDYSYLTVKDILERIYDLSKYEDDPSEMPRVTKEACQKAAEKIFNWLRADDNTFDDNTVKKENRRGRDMLPDKLKEIIKQAVLEGFVNVVGDDNSYGFSEENINVIVDIWNSSTDETTGKLNEPINAQMLNRHIKVILAEEGNKWKFKTNDQWRKAGYVDPLGDED